MCVIPYQFGVHWVRPDHLTADPHQGADTHGRQLPDSRDHISPYITNMSRYRTADEEYVRLLTCVWLADLPGPHRTLCSGGRSHDPLRNYAPLDTGRGKLWGQNPDR